MKEDAPPPKHPPRKRYQLEKAPDFWLAVWANDEELPEHERERAQAVRDTRKAAQPDRAIGVLVDKEDVTPVQLEFLREKLSTATEIHQPWASRRVAAVCRHAGAPVTVHQTMRDVVLASAVILGVPRAPEHHKNGTPAWELITYAKHRKLDITIMLPDGSIERR